MVDCDLDDFRLSSLIFSIKFDIQKMKKLLFTLLWVASGLLAAYIGLFLYFQLAIFPHAIVYNDQPSQVDKTQYNAGDTAVVTFNRCANGEYNFTASRKIVNTIEWNIVGLQDSTVKGCVKVNRLFVLPKELYPDTYHFENTVTAQIHWFIFKQEKMLHTSTVEFSVIKGKIDGAISTE
jgi:hypothetical protein